MKKKMITLLLAGIMAFSLSACGETQDTNEDKKETNADTETTPQAEKTEDDKNTLMVWGHLKKDQYHWISSYPDYPAW